jgi:hypothetical protein
VDLQDVNISAEPGDGGVDGVQDVFARQADSVYHLAVVGGDAADVGGGVVGRDTEVALGEDDDTIAGNFELFESFANDLFRAAV